MGETIEYGDVVQEVRGSMQPGRLKLQSNSIIFKNIKTGKVETFQAGDVVSAKWLLRARGQCLKIMLENGLIHRFDGLKESEYDRLSEFISKYYNTDLQKVETSCKGWNWGTATFIGNALNFEVANKEAFEVPLNYVSHATSGKNEATMEFHQNDDAAVSLMEIRFHVPTTGADDASDPVQEFVQNVLEKADIIQATGDAITTFQEVQCLTPRGRYDIKIYPTFLQLHGKTFDYKIPYTTILRLFLLPHKDGRQMFFVVSLDPPIKQGMTRYPFLILLFNKEDETTLELALSEEELNEKYEGKLNQEMSGPEYEIISRIMKALVNRKITVPGSFVGHHGTHCISCSYKAATGFLYPLERGFIFVHKPPMHIRFDEVSCVNFARSSGSTRSFDFEVETKMGNAYTFVSIDKEEYGKLYDFVTQRKLKVKNIGGKLDQAYKDDLMDSEDDGEQHDAYLERMKNEGKDRQSDDLDDDTDSSDESFNPGESASSVEEEYTSNVSTSSSSSSEEESGLSEGELQRRKEAKKEKKEKEKKKKTKTKTVSERKPRKSKKKKDKDAPKRPPTSYMMWLNEHREQILEENPGFGVTDVAKKGGEMWREVTAEEKAKYDSRIAELKEKYQEEMKAYKEKLAQEDSEGDSDDDDEERPKKTKSKSPKKSPKKPISSTAGSGANYKSKEYISESESSDSDSDKPLKKKAKKEVKKEKGKKGKKEEEGLKTRSKRGKKGSGSDSGPESLPSDHEEEIIEGTPDPSGSDGGGKSESESEAASDSGSGSD